MPRLSSLTLCALAACLAAAGCDRQTAGEAQPRAEREGAESSVEATGETPFNGRLDIASRGARMPDATLTDPAGKRLRLADLRGRPVLINLWATWCGPCVLEMPMLDALAREQGDKLKVLTVSEDIQGGAKVAPFFASKSFAHLEPWLDPENELSLHYGTGILPTTVLYDAQGREVWRMIGGHDWSGPRTAAMLADTLAGKPAA